MTNAQFGSPWSPLGHRVGHPLFPAFLRWVTRVTLILKNLIRERPKTVCNTYIVHASYIKRLAENGVHGVHGDPAFRIMGLRGSPLPGDGCPRRPTRFLHGDTT